MRWLLRIHDGLTQLTFWVSAASVAYLTIVTAWEVVGRYLLRMPSDWAPDTAAVSFAFVTFLAAPMLTWKGGHASMTAVVDHVPHRASQWMRRLTLLLAFLVCALCAWFGAQETFRLYTRGVTMITVTPLQKWWVMITVVYALASMALYFLRHLVATFMQSPSALTESGDGKPADEGLS